jgi:hypothetical protein
MTCVLALARITQRVRLETVEGAQAPRYYGGSIGTGRGPKLRVRRAGID